MDEVSRLDVYLILSLVLATAGRSLETCVLPDYPANGRHQSFESNCPAIQRPSPACRSVPGTTVPDGWFLFTTCNEGFELDIEEHAHSQSSCADGRWLPALPSCIYNLTNDHYKCKAPPYPKHGKYEPLPIECALNNKTENFLLPGSYVPESCVILYSCQPGYLLNDLDVMSICDQGKWIPDTVTCQGSDKISTKTTVSKEQSSGCLIPNNAQNRRYCSFQCKECTTNQCSYTPGSVVHDYVMKVQCSQGYRLTGNQDYAAIACVNGTWTTDFPRCLKLCPALESDSVYPRCLYGTTQVDCNKPMLPGTEARYQCKPSHTEYSGLTKAGVYSRTLTCRHDGRWNHVLPECEPVCGVSKGGVKITPTIVDGTDTPLGAFPWHAGLYRWEGENWACICGGTLITNRVILSAAHCVVVQSPGDLRVALGKYHRAWSYDEPLSVRRSVGRPVMKLSMRGGGREILLRKGAPLNNTNTIYGDLNKLKVSAIRVPREFNGAVTTYAWDIALLLLTDKIQINSVIMPVCRDVQLALKITEKTTGYVVGWGKTIENGKESETLLHNDLSIIDYSVCLRKIPKVLAFDKFCGAKGSASVAEKGDSGGGVTTIYNDQHYIIGIVSVKINNLSVFTNVSWMTHKSWIENEIINFDKDINLAEKY